MAVGALEGLGTYVANDCAYAWLASSRGGTDRDRAPGNPGLFHNTGVVSGGEATGCGARRMRLWKVVTQQSVLRAK